MKRRDFVKGGLAAAAAMGLADFFKAYAAGTEDAAVGKALAKWQPGHFQIHSIYSGIAESLFIIYPDGTTLMLDAGDHPAHARGKLCIPIMPPTDPRVGGKMHAGEWFARYVLRVNPNGKKVDRFLLSHYHNDHGGGKTFHAGPSADGSYVKSGLGQVIDFLDIAQSIDRAWPTFDDPLPVSPGADGGMLSNLRPVYAEMQRRGVKIEKFKLEKGSTQLDPLRGKVDGFSVRPICANGRFLLPDGTVKDIYAHLKNGTKKPRAFNENGMSLGMVFTYGKFRFFTAGDLSDQIKDAKGAWIQTEDLLGEAAGAVNVAKVNHHGHHAMFPGLVKALKAQVYFACMWDQLHMTPDTMARLGDRSLYPDERLLCPSVFTDDHLKAKSEGKAWAKDIPESVREPKHLVFDVPPGGETFSLSFVRAKDDTMTVESVMNFRTR